MLVLFLSAHAFICAAARPVPVATTLIAVGVSVMRFRVILDDFFRDLVEDLAPHLLIFLDLLALTSSAISHERPRSFGEPQPTVVQGVCHVADQRVAPQARLLRFPSTGFHAAFFVLSTLLSANRPDEHDVDEDEDEQQNGEIQEEREHVARVYPQQCARRPHL